MSGEQELLKKLKEHLKDSAMIISELKDSKVIIKISANHKVKSCSLNIEEVDI